LKSAEYIFNTARHLGDEIEWKRGGIVETRARQVLGEAHDLLREVEGETIWEAVAKGAFADVKRRRDGGKGFAGVVAKAPTYLNPFVAALEKGKD
jgi:beta-lysine 5,6-aminomutase alpha subunit